MSLEEREESDATAGKPEAGFEESLAAVESAVERLESGELTLEEAMATYERGYRSLRRCHAILRRTRGRIEALCAEDEDGAPRWEELRLDALDDDGESSDEPAGGPGDSS